MLAREEMLRKLHVRDEYYRRRARQSFAEFLRYTKPDYQLSWFHEELATELDQFFDDVLERPQSADDRHLPTTGRQIRAGIAPVSGLGVGQESQLAVVACSYSATSALQFSRNVRLIMDEPNYARLFAESVIPGFATKRNAAVRQPVHFELVRHHGSYRCAGVQRVDCRLSHRSVDR